MNTIDLYRTIRKISILKCSKSLIVILLEVVVVEAAAVVAVIVVVSVVGA